MTPVLNTATFTKDSHCISSYKSQDSFEDHCERIKCLLDVFDSNIVNQGHLCIEDFAEKTEIKIKVSLFFFLSFSLQIIKKIICIFKITKITFSKRV